MPDLNGHTALVTGATSGIGRATAVALAAAGATVAVSGRDKDRGHEVVEAIQAAGGSAVFVGADLIDATAATDLAARATDAQGGRVNAISPGPTRTEGSAGMGEALDQLASLAPAGRPASPEEIASGIVFLVSDEASFVHGAALAADGGRSATLSVAVGADHPQTSGA